MPLTYADLDATTRKYMLAELDEDVDRSRLYISARLKPTAVRQYEALLRRAIEIHDDAWLAVQLAEQDLLLGTEQRRNRGGGNIAARVPANAAELLADGEFNRFYCRGLCARVVDEGGKVVEVYRGKETANPRAESAALVGQQLDATAVLYDLRSSQGVEPGHGVPFGPNSSLTLRMVR